MRALPKDHYEMTILATSKASYPDPDAHEPGCISDENDVVYSDAIAGYVDLFCSCHRYTEPKVLCNGTDIAWPAGWDQKQATKWRAANGLLEPGAIAMRPSGDV